MTRATLPSQASIPSWSYHEAFGRHRGLISAQEQTVLQGKRVAIVGQGGVGGIHLITLARLGIGGFHIADPDRFELANFNRQYGANTWTVGQNKASVMAELARAINPELQLRVFTEAITPNNIDDLLDGVDLVLDGIDFFSLDTRRLVFREARRRGIWALTAGPIGFSAAWLVFAPNGMSFDDYFDLDDRMDRADQLVAFLAGLTPRASHLAYLDLSQVDPQSGRGPSAGLACQLCAGVAATEAVKILLDRGPIRPAPWFFQFDAFRHRLYQGRLSRGNRSASQRLKRWLMKKKLAGLGWRI
jgi:molybdopterin/thiamine biosynthesis adenylyltransferase